MDNLKTNLAKVAIDETGQEASEQDELKWGLPLKEAYRFALKFYKGKNFIKKKNHLKTQIKTKKLLQINQGKPYT